MSGESEIYRKEAEGLVAKGVKEKLETGEVGLRVLFMAGDKCERMYFGTDYHSVEQMVEKLVDIAIQPGGPIEAVAVCREVVAGLISCSDDEILDDSGKINKDAAIKKVKEQGDRTFSATTVSCLLSIRGEGSDMCLSIINGDHASKPAWSDGTAFVTEGDK